MKEQLSEEMRSLKVHQLEFRDRVAIIRFDNDEKVNCFSVISSVEFKSILKYLSNCKAFYDAIVFSSTKPDCFFAGADVKLFSEWDRDLARAVAESAQETLQMLLEIDKPTVAAVMGVAMGAGLEIVLTLDYCIAMRDSKTIFSLPEVMLGLNPALGGTQFLPRKIGLTAALDMMLTGKSIRPEQALQVGLIERVIDPSPNSTREEMLVELEAVAVQTAKDLASGALPNPKPHLFTRLMCKALEWEAIRDFTFSKARKQVERKTLGLYPAPFQILDAVESGFRGGVDAGLKAEADNFVDLSQTHESKCLVKLFFAQTECKKNRFGPFRPMGALKVNGDSSECEVAAFFEKKWKDSTKGRRLSEVCDSNHNWPSTFNLICEPSENFRKDFNEGAIYAFKTSYLSLKDIVGTHSHDNVVGYHYFQPVDRSQLVEVIKCPSTAPETVSSAVEVVLSQGKIAIVVNDGPGLYTTRIFVAYALEVIRLLVEGLSIEQVEKLTKKIGFAVGCMTHLDAFGLDEFAQAAHYLASKFGARFQSEFNLIERMVANGFAGKKFACGWFVYHQGKPSGVNHQAEQLIADCRGSERISYDEDELRVRLLSRVINEAALCLEEGILSTPLDGDVGAVFGIGFPPFLGGPFRYLDKIGTDRMARDLSHLVAVHGERFAPCTLLRTHREQPFFS